MLHLDYRDIRPLYAQITANIRQQISGGENYHGRFEYIPVEDMEKCVEMLVNILKMEGTSNS